MFQNKETMALNIGKIMAQKCVSQKELERRTGITQANISRIVNGKAQPNNKTIARIADALEVEIYELYEAPAQQFISCPHCGRTIYIVKDISNIGKNIDK